MLKCNGKPPSTPLISTSLYNPPQFKETSRVGSKVDLRPVRPSPKKLLLVRKQPSCSNWLTSSPGQNQHLRTNCRTRGEIPTLPNTRATRFSSNQFENCQPLIISFGHRRDPVQNVFTKTCRLVFEF